jgi:hypothetical protein
MPVLGNPDTAFVMAATFWYAVLNKEGMNVFHMEFFHAGDSS